MVFTKKNVLTKQMFLPDNMFLFIQEFALALFTLLFTYFVNQYFVSYLFFFAANM